MSCLDKCTCAALLCLVRGGCEECTDVSQRPILILLPAYLEVWSVSFNTFKETWQSSREWSREPSGLDGQWSCHPLLHVTLCRFSSQWAPFLPGKLLTFSQLEWREMKLGYVAFFFFKANLLFFYWIWSENHFSHFQGNLIMPWIVIHLISLRDNAVAMRKLIFLSYKLNSRLHWKFNHNKCYEILQSLVVLPQLKAVRWSEK